MAVSATVKAKLNKMNRAAQDAELGEYVSYGVFGGSLVPSAAQISASAVTVYNALATNGFYQYQIFRSGSPLYVANGYIPTRSGGSLTISVRNSGSFTANDVVQWLIG